MWTIFIVLLQNPGGPTSSSALKHQRERGDFGPEWAWEVSQWMKSHLINDVACLPQHLAMSIRFC